VTALPAESVFVTHLDSRWSAVGEPLESRWRAVKVSGVRRRHTPAVSAVVRAAVIVCCSTVRVSLTSRLRRSPRSPATHSWRSARPGTRKEEPLESR
jgi:hypothetical protein